MYKRMRRKHQDNYIDLLSTFSDFRLELMTCKETLLEEIKWTILSNTT
jgi:hypothetical protein